MRPRTVPARAAALAVLLPGCLVVPYPVQPRISPARIAPYAAPEATDLSSFRPGTTTRDDVLLRLGEPDRVVADGRALVYLGVDRRYGAAVFAWFPGFGGGLAPQSDVQGPFVALVLTFDGRGVLERVESPHEEHLTLTSAVFFDRLDAVR